MISISYLEFYLYEETRAFYNMVQGGIVSAI